MTIKAPAYLQLRHLSGYQISANFEHVYWNHNKLVDKMPPPVTLKDGLIQKVVHLTQFRNSDEGRKIMLKVAHRLKPILKAHGWKVGMLSEFLPSDRGLLGLNTGMGSPFTYAFVMVGITMSSGPSKVSWIRHSTKSVIILSVHMIGIFTKCGIRPETNISSTRYLAIMKEVLIWSAVATS